MKSLLDNYIKPKLDISVEEELKDFIKIKTGTIIRKKFKIAVVLINIPSKRMKDIVQILLISIALKYLLSLSEKVSSIDNSNIMKKVRL